MNNLKARIVLKKDQYEIFKKIQNCEVEQATLKKIKLQPSYKDSHKDSYKDLIQDLASAMQSLEQRVTTAFSKLNQNAVNNLIETRDKRVEYPLPEMTKNCLENEQNILKWITNICSTTFSIAFQQYSVGSMTFQQCKIFCSENILRNLALLVEKNSISSQTFESIGEHIKKKVLKYMMKKYPTTENIGINKPLNSIIKEIDNYHNLENDFFYSTSIVFELRDSSNYNDLIMRVLNQKMNEIDELPQNLQNQLFNDYGLTNYKKFQNYFASLFQKIQDQDWMNEKDRQQVAGLRSNFLQTKIVSKNNSSQTYNLLQNIGNFYTMEEVKKKLTKREIEEIKQKQRKRMFQKQKYKQKVRQYTTSLIGRKINQNVSCYTQKQINSLHMTIKNSAVLRVLTKWCNELWQKFDVKSYYLSHHEEGLKVQRGGNVNILTLNLKQSLDVLMCEQKVKIEQFMEQVKKNNYQMQSLLLKKELIEDHKVSFIQNIERACGVFSIKVVNNLHNYVITYLNRLIHGLLSVSKKWYEINYQSLNRQIWPSPPNLLTFKIGDLIRCKCASRERQIIKIFRQIQKVSREQPHILKIIRVKNRLKFSTNDILINIRFNSRIICEIQLAVNTQKSHFISNSNKFNHFLYQLQRSTFGPITELCNVWFTLDTRSAIYQSILADQQELNEDKQEVHACQKQKNKVVFKPFDRPFICSECKISYSHNNFIKKHMKCEKCAHWKCARCQIQHDSTDFLLKNLIFDVDQRNKCQRVDKNNFDSFEYGICILIESKIPQLEYFRKIEINQKKYVFGIKNDQIYQIADISQQKKIVVFLKGYIIFGLKTEQGKKIINITKERVNNELVLPNYIKETYKKQRQTISLQEEKLNSAQCLKLLEGDMKEKQNIRSIDLEGNKLTEIDFICDWFPNLTWLQLSQNNIQNYQKIGKLINLEKLFISGSLLENGQFPTQICKLQKLEVLDLHKSRLRRISYISNLTKLKSLDLGKNDLQNLPDSLCQLQKMEYLSIYANKIKNLPEEIGKLSRLETLIACDNQLYEIPYSMSLLSNLIKLDLRSNQLYSLNISFSELTKLEELQLSDNQLTSLPQSLCYVESLKSLNIQNNFIEYLPSKIQWINLHTLNITSNRIFELSQSFFRIKKIERIEASYNQISSINEMLVQFTHLQTLNMNYNKLKNLPQNICLLQNLKFISISHNSLQKIPENIGNLNRLEFLYLSSNKITQIPVKINGCYSLKQIYLNDNKIKIIPESLKFLENLEDKQLDLSENPLQIINCIQFILQKGDYDTKKLVLKISNNSIQNEEDQPIPHIDQLKYSLRKQKNSRRAEIYSKDRKSYPLF